MCYYNPAISLSRRPVGEPALIGAIQEAARDLDLRVLAFAGKEPFLNANLLFRLMAEAAQIPDRSFLIGVVSNGRHIDAHADALLRANDARQLDYIDISIDTADRLRQPRSPQTGSCRRLSSPRMAGGRQMGYGWRHGEAPRTGSRGRTVAQFSGIPMSRGSVTVGPRYVVLADESRRGAWAEVGTLLFGGCGRRQPLLTGAMR